jgi:hypothetical protein
MIKLTTLLAGLFFFTIAKAQNNVIQYMDVFIQIYVEDNTVDSLTNLQVFKEPQMNITLSDTANINSFVVKLGTTEGSGDILTKTFNFLETGPFPDGTSYIRNGGYVYFLLGKYLSLPPYHAQVIANVNGENQSAVGFLGQ